MRFTPQKAQAFEFVIDVVEGRVSVYVGSKSPRAFIPY
jgi:hypothetical protein